ncbi:MAG: 4Fe-4S dicluster domain-containing protein [Chloroflexota bacterium]
MKAITRDALAAWLDRLASEQTLIAPRRIEGVLLYRPVSRSDEIAPMSGEQLRPVVSVKQALFPPTEPLMTIEVRRQDGQPATVHLKETLPQGKQVVFGVRPCDARGLRVLDAMFLEEGSPDPYYARRRQETTLIGLACMEMGPTCFCKSVGGAPDDPADVDILLRETERGYSVQVVTEKGRHILAGVPLEEDESEIPRSALNEPIPVPDTLAWPPHFQDDYWRLLGERCLSCRICAYVCPTCRCFDVRDEPRPSDDGTDCYERLRCWDSCTGPNYRRMAGGHNPRPTPGARLRNRFFCKFYYYPEQYGPVACTGCGRCIDSCPVNIDITEVLAHLVAG